MTVNKLGELVAMLLWENGIKLSEAVITENCGTIWIEYDNNVYVLSLQMCDEDTVAVHQLQ